MSLTQLHTDISALRAKQDQLSEYLSSTTLSPTNQQALSRHLKSMFGVLSSIQTDDMLSLYPNQTLFNSKITLHTARAVLSFLDTTIPDKTLTSEAISLLDSIMTSARSQTDLTTIGQSDEMLIKSTAYDLLKSIAVDAHFLNDYNAQTNRTNRFQNSV